MEDCFKPFAARVRTLRIYQAITRPTLSMKIILLFPAVVNIDISSPRWSSVDEHSTLQPPRREETRFTGFLYLSRFGGEWSEFLTLLSRYKLGFVEVRMVACEFGTSVPTQALLDAVSQSVFGLQLDVDGKRRFNLNLLRKLG